MLKKRVVASFVGNLSPVKRSMEILVRRARHRRGDIGEELKSRANVKCQYCYMLEGTAEDIPSWKTMVRSCLKPDCSASSSLFA